MQASRHAMRPNLESRRRTVCDQLPGGRTQLRRDPATTVPEPPRLRVCVAPLAANAGHGATPLSTRRVSIYDLGQRSGKLVALAPVLLVQGRSPPLRHKGRSSRPRVRIAMRSRSRRLEDEVQNGSGWAARIFPGRLALAVRCGQDVTTLGRLPLYSPSEAERSGTREHLLTTPQPGS